MALLRKLFFRKPPEGLLEICEGVYVFDCCFTTDAWKEENYKAYIDGIIGQLREHLPDASILVFNFREEETKSQMANILSEYDITIMDYPRHYEGCPVLKMELIHHFLRSSESWLSLGQNNVLLMHCERGGWPVLAFMLAALLIYRKHYSGEQRTLDMVYRQAPRELLHLLTPFNPFPSQLRYMQYVSRRNVALEWPPLDRALTLDCIILRFIPNFDAVGGCRPIFRIYGQDPFIADKAPKILYSTPKRGKNARAYRQGECELIKIDINCHIQGDVVIESINLNGDMEREHMIFRVMFNTAFIRSNILMLNRDEIDTLWDARDHFPKDFRAEILFSEIDAAAAVIPNDISCFEEKEGLPMEAFSKVQEMFNKVDWLNPKADVALDVLQQIRISAVKHDKLDTSSDPDLETVTLLHQANTRMHSGKKTESNSSLSLTSIKSVSPTKQSPDNDTGKKGNEPVKIDAFPRDMPNVFRKTLPQSSDTSSFSLSPRTPPPPPPSRPPWTKDANESPPYVQTSHHHLFPLKLKRPVTEETEARSQERIQSSTFSSTPGTPFSSTSSNKLQDDSTSNLSASAVTSTLPPPSSPSPSLPTTLVKKIFRVITEPASTSPHPPTPPPPATPPLKDQVPVTVGPPQAPPQPPVEEPGDKVGRLPPTPPPPLPVKEESHVRAGPPPPPPPPLKMEQPGRAEPPPLKKEQPVRAGPPPPPPPPYLSRKAASPSVAPPPPPPPAVPFSKNSNPSLQNSTVPSAPAAPPPPTLFGKGGLPGPFPGSLSAAGDGNNVSPITGPQPSSLNGSKGRILSRTISSKNTKKLKPLHWLKLSRAVQGSLWAEAQKSGEASKAPEIDISELEHLFSAAVPSSGSAKKQNIKSSANPKSERVQLIDHRRAYNCEIMLSQVKVPLDELMSSMLALEESALNTDQVENLIKFCPTKEEMDLLKGYTGEKEKLGRCEQFFLELMKIPRVECKLRVFSFKIQFHSQVSDLRSSLNVVNSAAEEIKNSVKLKRVMQTILSLGNALNQGTARGSAIGFRLDSLLKLAETRARNNKMTLMHYLCKVLADKLPEVLDFTKDLANLEPAAKIQLKFLAEEMQAISKGLDKVIQELSTSENDGPISENFRKKLKEFLCSAEAEVRSLASLYSGVGRNVDSLILYFGEDPSRCPFEQVMSTLLNFTRMFNKAHEENCKQHELEIKKTAESEKKMGESERILPTAIRTSNCK